MRLLYRMGRRLRSLVRFRAVDAELNEELRFHIERQTAENIAAGMTPDAALRSALLELGGIEQIKEECRDMRRMQWVESSLQDEPKVSTAAPNIDKGKIFSKDEIRAISRSLGDAAGKRRNLGPRGVRAFLFRYQLARMLLSNLGVSWSPQSLANELADRFFSENPSAQAETPLNSVDFAPLQRVVNQVA